MHVLWSAARDCFKGHLRLGLEELVIYTEKGDNQAGGMIKQNVMKNPQFTFNFVSSKARDGPSAEHSYLTP